VNQPQQKLSFEETHARFEALVLAARDGARFQFSGPDGGDYYLIGAKDFDQLISARWATDQ
jgi:hypothetical protein